MIEPNNLNQIIEILNMHVIFAYIFGSSLTKYFTSKSDIDLAVWLLNYPISTEFLIDLKFKIEKKINFEHNIDFVIVNKSNIIIENQIITNGKLIIDNNPPFTENYYISRRSLYFEFKEWRKNIEINLNTKVL
jgi:predicted nucleotidyltransferase